MAKELGSLYYTIGVKGEKDAVGTLKRVTDAIAKSKRIESVAGVSMAVPSEGSGASAVKDARAIATKEAKALGFELASLVKDVRSITKQQMSAFQAKGQTNVRGAFSPAQKVLSVGQKATERTVKHELLHAIDAAIGGGNLASTIKGHLHNRLAKAFAPTRFKEIVQSESFGKMDQKRKDAYLKYSMLPQELFVNLMERQSDEFKRAVFGTSRGSNAKVRQLPNKLIDRSLADRLASARERDADQRHQYNKSHYSSNENFVGFLGPHNAETSEALAERDRLNAERLAARRAGNKGAIGNRFFHGMGLPSGSIGGSGSVFGVGRPGPVVPAVPPEEHGPPAPLGPPLPPPLPRPWLYRVNDTMSLGGHRNLTERAGNASALSDEITGEVLNHRINTLLVAARGEIRDAQRDQRVASRAGDPVAMDAANQRLNTAQNQLMDTEERRLFVAGQHRDIIRDVNTYLGTTVTLESRIAAAEESAVNYARQRMQNMTPGQEAGVRERAREGLLSRVAHGGTKAAQYEQDRDELRAKRRESGQYVTSAAGQNDVVAREYYNNLKSAEAIRRRQAENEHRMAEIRQANGGEAPGMFQGGRREYRTLERDQKQLEIRMMRHNDVLKGVSSANNRWNTQIMELGYGIQDFTQVLAGGGGLSAALRGASNNMSQFFAVGGGKNAALWATGIGVGALAIGMALDAISKQSEEAANRLKAVRESAESLSRVNLGSLSSIRSSEFNSRSPSIRESNGNSAFDAVSVRETVKAAQKEIALDRGTRTWMTNFGDFIGTDLPRQVSYAFDGVMRGNKYSDRRFSEGEYSTSADTRDAVDAYLARLSGKTLDNSGSIGREAINKRGLNDGMEYLRKAGVPSAMVETLRKAKDQKLSSDSEKRISLEVDKYNEDKHKDITARSGGMAGFAAQRESLSLGNEIASLDEKKKLIQKELDLYEKFKKKEKGGVELTPEAAAQYKSDVERISKKSGLVSDRKSAIDNGAIGQIADYRQVSGTFDSLASAVNEYKAQSNEILSVNPGGSLAYQKAALMNSAIDSVEQVNPSKRDGEHLIDFEARVNSQIASVSDLLDKNAGTLGQAETDRLKERLRQLGDAAVDVAISMGNYNQSLTTVIGKPEREQDAIKDIASINRDLADAKRSNNLKYEKTDPAMEAALNQIAQEDADRKIKRREFQRTKDENADKMFFGNKIASLVGGRRGAKLQAEMEYDQQLAAIEDSKMDPQLKAEKVQEAKDMREAELEKIDRKNVSFTDVGSTWKTIQSSLQADPNKKILSHWNKYMGLVTGDGIRVKLGIGT